MFESKEKKTTLKSEKRFVTKSAQMLGMCGIQIIVDTETGVNYLNTNGTAYSGLTPLLDSNGKVVIDPVEKEKA